MAGSSSDLIQLRMKLIGNKVVVSGTDQVSKSVKGLGKATTETSTKQRYAERTTSRLTTSYKKLGTAAKWGLGFLGVGGVVAIHSSIAATEELGKATSSLSRNYGFATNVASRWAAVMASRESDPKALTQALGTLSTKMVTAGREGGKSLTAFHLLGLSQEEVARGAKDFEWGLLRVADALGKEEGSSKRSAAAKALLGKGFQLLTPLFSEGVKGLKEQLHWADKYSVTLNTTTNDAIMGMVSAQRENKVAMLGLQLSLTKALMPAIHAGDEELQKFIATLNSPNLTAEQKMNRISNQFIGLENEIVKVIDRAAPKIAENAGHLGVAMAGALWNGFVHSDTLGKLAVGGWLFHSMGGFSAIGKAGSKAGWKLGKSLGFTFLATVAPYFAAEAGVEGIGSALGSRMGSLKTVFAGKGRILGAAMGVVAAGALIAEIVFAVENSEDIAGLSLFDTPKVGMTSIEEEAKRLTELGYTGIGFNSGHELVATNPGGKHITEVQKGGDWVTKRGGKVITASGTRNPSAHRTPKASKRPRNRELMATPVGSRGGGLRSVIVQSKTVLPDGRVLAEVVTEHALDAGALK